MRIARLDSRGALRDPVPPPTQGEVALETAMGATALVALFGAGVPLFRAVRATLMLLG